MEKHRNQAEVSPAAQPPTKQSYQRPELVKQGKVEEITKGFTSDRISCPPE